MLKLTLDSLVVTSYAPLPEEGDEVMAPDTRGCTVVVPSTQYVGCQTYNCSGDPACTTGGGYAC